MEQLIERMEFQLRGAIHSHWLMWTQKGIEQMIQEDWIRADIPDPNLEPMLYYLVMRYQIHHCQDHICGGVRRFGTCKKGAPWPVSDHTFHEPGNPRYTYRRGPADTRVSPYNAELLLLWQGHLNVQYATS